MTQCSRFSPQQIRNH